MKNPQHKKIGNNLSNRERMSISRQQMPQRDGKERIADFREVNLGLPEHVAIQEARRCLQCKNPRCRDGCPVGIDIPAFIHQIAEGRFMEAAAIIRRDNNLPSITGRVCPQEIQCEALCVRCNTDAPVAIGWLERFVADYEAAHQDDAGVKPIGKTGRKVAIIGGGPSGITCAGELARRGHEATIFEAFHKVGGVLIYGIPEFRLPNDLVENEINRLKASGVSIETNVIVGRTVSLQQLLTEEGYDAAFISVGAGLPVFMNIRGENLKGVYSANEFLTRSNLMEASNPNADTPVIRGRKVCVVGGGNTAMDAVRTSKRMGAEESIIIYRRDKEQMPARTEEVHHAEEEGIRFELLTAPVEVLGSKDGWVTGLKCVRIELGEPDTSGRRRPVPIINSEFTIECDEVIVAIGINPNPLLTHTTPELKLNKFGYIETDDDLRTSIPGVFAGGDIVRGAATVILAMGDGKKAAAKIHDYLT